MNVDRSDIIDRVTDHRRHGALVAGPVRDGAEGAAQGVEAQVLDAGRLAGRLEPVVNGIGRPVLHREAARRLEHQARVEPGQRVDRRSRLAPQRHDAVGAGLLADLANDTVNAHLVAAQGGQLRVAEAAVDTQQDHRAGHRVGRAEQRTQVLRGVQLRPLPASMQARVAHARLLELRPVARRVADDLALAAPVEERANPAHEVVAAVQAERGQVRLGNRVEVAGVDPVDRRVVPDQVAERLQCPRVVGVLPGRDRRALRFEVAVSGRADRSAGDGLGGQFGEAFGEDAIGVGAGRGGREGRDVLRALAGDVLVPAARTAGQPVQGRSLGHFLDIVLDNPPAITRNPSVLPNTHGAIRTRDLRFRKTPWSVADDAGHTRKNRLISHGAGHRKAAALRWSKSVVFAHFQSGRLRQILDNAISSPPDVSVRRAGVRRKRGGR